MSLLPMTSLLSSLNLKHVEDSSRPKSTGKPQQQQRTLASRSSLANLIQFARNPLQQVEVVEDWYDGSNKEERMRKQQVEDRKQLLYLKMRTVTNHADWEAAAREVDELEGNNEWKYVFESADYDAGLVEARLKQLDEARISCDIGRMLFLIRTSLNRDLGDMGNLRLYKHSHVGTKDQVERYITSALETLEALLEVSAKAKCDGMESKYILEQVLSSRQAFGRSALLLSGGATFGMSHIGVLKALHEARLLPRIISGASAGSIVSSVICTRSDEDVPHVLATFCEGDLAVFEEEGNEDGLLRKAARFLKHGALYDIAHLTRVMKNLLGDLTFQEAYNRTRKILNICVSSASLYELPRLLNYITAPNVLIWSAVAASCSVPFVYTAASLLAKDPRTGDAVPWNPSPQRWIDGSVDNDIPMTRLAEMFNVNHFIVSQVNPHVIPFLIREEGVVAKEAQQSTSSLQPGPTWLDSLSHLAKGEALHRMNTMAELGFFPNLLTKTISVLSQKYSGDITILPEISYADFPRMLSNPTPDFMSQAMLSGERATWPKISIIKNHCAIELALDDAVQKFRTRVVFSPSEVELRLNTNASKASATHKAVKRRTNKRRPLSQNSNPDPSTTTTPTNHTNHPKSGRLTPSLRHKKSRSINTVLAEPSASMLTPSPSPTPPSSLHTKPPNDITASSANEDEEDADAETSNLPTSSSSTSLSCSSPNEEPHQAKWHRSLFGSRSGPTTPTPFGAHSSTLPTNPKPGSSIPKPTSSAFRMTPSAASNAAGASSKYKRLFQHRPQGQHSAHPTSTLLGKQRAPSPRPRNGAPPDKEKEGTTSGKRAWGSPPPPPPAAGARGGADGGTTGRAAKKWGLELDIPASAKGLVGRGKKRE